MLCVKITILSQVIRTEGWLPDPRHTRLASRPGSMNAPYSFLARAVIDLYLLQVIDQARAGHRLTFRNTGPVCKLQPVCVMHPEHIARVFSLSQFYF